MKRLIRLSILFACMSFAFENQSSAQQDDVFRLWQDYSMSFSVKAKIIGIDGLTVRLLGQDGQKFEVPWSKLSKQDQVYLTSLNIGGAEITTSSSLDPLVIRSMLWKEEIMDLESVMFLRTQILGSLASHLQQVNDAETVEAQEKKIRQLIGCFRLSELALRKRKDPTAYEIKKFKERGHSAYEHAATAYNTQHRRLLATKSLPAEFLELLGSAKLQDLDTRTKTEIVQENAAAAAAAEAERRRPLSASEQYSEMLTMMEIFADGGKDNVGNYLAAKEAATAISKGASYSEKIKIGLISQERSRARSLGK